MTGPKRVAYSLIALGVVASGAFLVNATLSSAFARLHYARIFPLGYERRTSDCPISGLTAESGSYVDLTLYGDSRSTLWRLPELPSIRRVRDQSHGGTTSAQLRLELMTERPVASRWAVVQIGINDLHPLGALPKPRERAIENLRQNLACIADLTLANHDRVVMLTIIAPGPVPWSRRLLWDKATPEWIHRANDSIRALPDSRPRLTILDAARILDGGRDYLTADLVDPDFFLHLSPKAYSMLNEELRRIVERP